MSTKCGPNIITDGLVLYLDNDNIKSYIGSGSNWNDLVSKSLFTNTNYTWANNISQITICAVVEKIGLVGGYASHPISKWNSGTTNASFVLYHFGNNDDGSFGFYRTSTTGGWSGQVYNKRLVIGDIVFMAFQYNTLTGGQLWFNDTKNGAKNGSGNLGVGGTSGISISGPIGSGGTLIHNVSFYNRELADSEIIEIFNIMKIKYKL